VVDRAADRVGGAEQRCRPLGPGGPQGRDGQTFHRSRARRPVTGGLGLAERVPQQRRPWRDVSGFDLEDAEPGSGQSAHRRPDGQSVGLAAEKVLAQPGSLGQVPLPPGEFRPGQAQIRTRICLRPGVPASQVENGMRGGVVAGADPQPG
jgi:hypothetical protein